MDFKSLGFLLADALMVVAGCFYGWKLLKKRNYLLGLEWLIVGLSGANFFVFFLTGSPFLYNISYFFDAFSRGFGFPIIATVGLMAVTHSYRPSPLVDAVYFALCVLGAIVLVAVDSVAPAKPWFYLVMWTVYSIYLVYFAGRLLRAGQTPHAFGLLLVMLTSQAIASIYDFYHLPGDDEQHTLFYVLALFTWSFALVETYYAYCALERALDVHRSERQGPAVDVLEREPSRTPAV
jgi:hypothetical protein